MSGTWLHQDWQILQKLIWWAPLEWNCHDMISVEYHSASHCLKTFSDTIQYTLNYYSRHQWIEIELTNPQSTCPKFAYFCSEWCIVGRETSALWDLWDWSIVELVYKTKELQHGSDVTWTSWRLISPAGRLFVQQLVQPNNKEIVNVPHDWLLWGTHD